jgi:hypothetical protein
MRAGIINAMVAHQRGQHGLEVFLVLCTHQPMGGVCMCVRECVCVCVVDGRILYGGKGGQVLLATKAWAPVTTLDRL